MSVWRHVHCVRLGLLITHLSVVPCTRCVNTLLCEIDILQEALYLNKAVTINKDKKGGGPCVGVSDYLKKCSWGWQRREDVNRPSVTSFAVLHRLSRSNSFENMNELRECIQKFPDWPPGARTANGTIFCH
jgi:hypothetical protein